MRKRDRIGPKYKILPFSRSSFILDKKKSGGKEILENFLFSDASYLRIVFKEYLFFLKQTWAHIGNGGSVSDGKGGDPGSEKFDKFSDDPDGA